MEWVSLTFLLYLPSKARSTDVPEVESQDEGEDGDESPTTSVIFVSHYCSIINNHAVSLHLKK